MSDKLHRLMISAMTARFLILKNIKRVFRSDNSREFSQIVPRFKKLRIHSARKIYYKSGLVECSKRERASQKCDTLNI